MAMLDLRKHKESLAIIQRRPSQNTEHVGVYINQNSLSPGGVHLLAELVSSTEHHFRL